MNRSITIETGRESARTGSRRAVRGIPAVLSGVAGRMMFFFGLAGGLAAGWIAFPELLYERRPQPMNFNHQVHTVDAGMECADCHSFRDDGSFTGIPGVACCADCHSEVMSDSPEERRLVDDYVTPEREIPWLVYSQQPQNVYFSHAPHVRLAEIECRRCHGDHGRSKTLPLYERNRISTYSRSIWGKRIAGGGPDLWDSMKMSDCSDCHADRDVQDHCLMCHK